MSLIHEALQNVETHFSKHENNQPSSHEHEKNKLYKVNKFSLTLNNSLFFIFILSGLVSVLYITYIELSHSPLVQSEEYSLPNTVSLGLEGNEVSETIEPGIDEALLLNDVEFSVPENIKNVDLHIDHSAVEDNINAIEGDITGSASYSIEDSAITQNFSNNIEGLPVTEEKAIYEFKSDYISENYAAEEVVAEVANYESNYFDMQKQAYHYILNEDFTRAIPLLKKILAIDENDYYANLNMALIDIQQNRLSDADRRLHKLKILYPFENRIGELIQLIRENSYG